jgi:hypothetical protein
MAKGKDIVELIAGATEEKKTDKPKAISKPSTI